MNGVYATIDGKPVPVLSAGIVLELADGSCACPACFGPVEERHGEWWCMAQHGKITSCCDGDR